MKVFFYPLVTSTLFYIIGIILNSYFPVLRSISVWMFVAVLFLTIINYLLLKNKHKRSTLLFLFLWLTLGILKSNLHNASTLNQHFTNFESKTNHSIQFIIKEELKQSKNFKKYIASIKSIDQIYYHGDVLVYLNDTLPELKISESILSYTKIEKLPDSKNPKEFSYSDYLKKQNIFGQLYIQNYYTTTGIVKNINYYVDQLRQNLIQSFAIHNYQENTQKFINAFLFGQRNEVSNQMSQDYTNAGVIHILAISGLHIAILYGILIYIYKLLNLGFNHRFIKLFISIVFLWTFALITGLSASVIRSVTMFTIIAIAMTFDKNQNIYNAMIVSLLLLTIYNPNYIFDVGLQLSYLSVFIIILCNPLYKKLHITKFKIVHLTTDLISITLSAQLFLLPLILYYFHQFPTLFLVANFIVIPLSNLILYGLVVILILNYLYPALSIALGGILEHLITWLNNYIAWIASSPYAVLNNIPYNKLLVILSFILIGYFLNFLFKINFKSSLNLLIGVFIFQLGFIWNYLNEKNKNELIVWNSYKKSIISLEDKNTLTVYSDSLHSNILNLIQVDNFSKEINLQKMKNFIAYKDKKIVVVNSEKTIDGIQPDIVILSNSPKVNMERILDKYKPKFLVVDASNYKTYIELWKKTCMKKNIPFHTTYEMGYYKIN